MAEAEARVGTLADLTPDPHNVRRHNQRNLDVISNAVQAVGMARSIVVDEDGRVLAGNGTIEAAGQVGIENVRFIEADGNEVIAVVRRGLTEAQKRTLAIADNRASELAEWDVTALLTMAEAGKETGFETHELDALRRLAAVADPRDDMRIDHTAAVTLESRGVDDDQTRDDRMARYENTAVRQIVLIMDTTGYEDTLIRFRAVQAAAPVPLDTNYDVVMYLLEQWEAAQHGNP